MMDTLDKFVTVKDGDVVMRMDKDEAPVPAGLRAAARAPGARRRCRSATGSRPKGPILIEIFPKHDDFAVRNVGLPGMIGALGACFGRVVTMDSPKARPPGEFQWEATLWHELAHVITLQMSNQRVPRWLTEGISVYEEKLARPEWGRGMDIDVRRHAERGRGDQAQGSERRVSRIRAMISLAYFQASLLVEHLVQDLRRRGLHKLLRAYGRASTPTRR